MGGAAESYQLGVSGAQKVVMWIYRNMKYQVLKLDKAGDYLPHLECFRLRNWLAVAAASFSFFNEVHSGGCMRTYERGQYCEAAQGSEVTGRNYLLAVLGVERSALWKALKSGLIRHFPLGNKPGSLSVGCR